MNWRWLLGAGIWAALWPVGLEARPPMPMAAEINIYPQVLVRDVSPRMVGAVLLPTETDRQLLQQSDVRARIKELGVRTVYFPTGCLAHTYNWEAPAEGQLTIDEFLEFCAAIDAEPCYVLNLQGGTLDRQGAPLPGASVEERIQYRHPVPEGCDGANAHYGTQEEALNLVRAHTIGRTLAGKRPLTRFVLGHDAWRRAEADWPPDVYSATAQMYARSMLEMMSEAAAGQRELANTNLAFVAVGYPTPRHEVDPTESAEGRLDIVWTREINRLAGLIDAVQEPIPPASAGAAGSLARTAGALAEVLAQRVVPGPIDLDADDYEGLGYLLPIEWVATADAPTDPRMVGAAARSFEQPFDTADVLSFLVGGPTARVYAHFLIGDDGRALLTRTGEVRAAGQAYRLLAGRIGDQLVRSDLETGEFDLTTSSGARLPVLSVSATRQDHELYVALVNRSTNRPVRAQLILRGCVVKPEAETRVLNSQGVSSATLVGTNPLWPVVPPLTAEVLHLTLEQVIELPLQADVTAFYQSVRLGETPVADTFTLNTIPVETADPSALIIPAQPRVAFAIDTDAEWLTVTPAVGDFSNEDPRDISVVYRTAGLLPGHYTATITVQSPQVYNSPLKLPVELVIRPVRPDFDGDGDVDADDFAKFADCMAAPAAVQAGPACAHARLNNDDRVDMRDYRLFQTCFSGPNARPGPECVE